MSTREFPKTYLKFEGKKVFDGKRRQYWIQDATEDMFLEIEDLLVNYYVGEEPTTKYLKCTEDPVSKAEFGYIWKKMLEEKYTIVCLTKDDEGKTKLAGFNLLYLVEADKKNDYRLNGKCTKSLFKIFRYMGTIRNFHEDFKLTSVMNALGLYVCPEYRGDGVGDHLLEGREGLCRNVGVGATLTGFSSIVSQKLAIRVGYEPYFEIDYEELGRIDPEMHIPDIHNHTKSLKYMYKLYK